MKIVYILLLISIILLIPVKMYAWPSGSCIVEITGSKAVCVGETITLQASCSEPTGGACSWSNTPGLTPSDCSAQFTGPFDGVFWVSVWYTGSGFKCNDVDRIPVGAKDADGDGHYSKDSCKLPNDDCNDNDKTIYPGATEVCDGKDNNCDGQVDESTDADGDGHYPVGACKTPNDDCDDTDNTVYGGAPEICDGKDNNCDAKIDEGFDQDGDGYTTCNNDCNDNDPLVYPEDGQCCPVPHLTPLTDPLAIDMENGDRVIYDNLTEDFRLSSVCFLSAVTEAGGAYDITSIYRPQEYQEHLIEVWDWYWKIMEGNTDLNAPECSALRDEIIAEYQGHGLQDTQRPVPNSAHTRGTAMDLTTTLPAGYDVDTLANNCGLYRPSPVRDPGHFQLQ